MNERKRNYDIFISYRREDGAVLAEGFAMALASQGFHVFFDKQSIEIGREFPEEISGAIEESREFIAIVSASYFGENAAGVRRICEEDDWVRKELALALQKAAKETLHIFPICVDCQPPQEEALPEDLQKMASMNFLRYDKYYDTFDKIVQTLRRGFFPDTIENALIGTIRDELKRIDIHDNEHFNVACKEVIKLIKTEHDEKALLHMISQTGLYSPENRYVAFYSLFSYYRRIQQVKKLLALVENQGMEFSHINGFFYFVMVEYYTLKFKLAESEAAEDEYLRKAVDFAKQALDVLQNNNGVIHSYCISVARALEHGIETDSGELDRAIMYVNKIISADPDYARYYSTKARLLSLKGEVREALVNIRYAQTLETPRQQDWMLRVAGYYRDECLIRLRASSSVKEADGKTWFLKEI